METATVYIEGEKYVSCNSTRSLGSIMGG